MSRLDHSLIAGLPAFDGLADADLDTILTRATAQRIAKDVAVFNQGGDAKSFFLLLDGQVRVVRSAPDGRQMIVRYIVSGELLGIAQAIGRDTYPASAIAAVDCVILAWPGKLWTEFASSFPSFGKATYKTVGTRLEDVQTQMLDIATRHVEQRIANALLRLIRQSGKKTDNGITIDFPISRQDIGEMTGTTLHTVSRVLSAWEEKGFVKSGRQQVSITKPHKLFLLAEGRTDRD